MFRNQLKKKPGRLPSFLDIFWFLCFNFCNIIVVVVVVVVFYFSSLLSRLKYNCSSYFRIILELFFTVLLIWIIIRLFVWLSLNETLP